MIETHGTAEELRARLGDEIRRIRRAANRLLFAAVMIWTVLVVGFWFLTGSLDSTSKLSTTAAYFVLFGWGTWFVYAYFLRMEAKQDVALELLMRSFAMATQSNQVLKEVKDQVQPIIQDVRAAMEDVMDVAKKVRKTVDQYDETGSLAKGFLEDAKKAFSGGNGVFGEIRDKLGELATALKPPEGGGFSRL